MAIYLLQSGSRPLSDPALDQAAGGTFQLPKVIDRTKEMTKEITKEITKE
jgi:hypothetical protein